jgi:hypothetical protein
MVAALFIYFYFAGVQNFVQNNLTGVILCVWKVLPLGVLLLKGQNGQTWKDHLHNCVSCHLPNVYGQIDSSLAMIPIGLRCMLYGQYFGITIILVCDQYS